MVRGKQECLRKGRQAPQELGARKNVKERGGILRKTALKKKTWHKKNIAESGVQSYNRDTKAKRERKARSVP